MHIGAFVKMNETDISVCEGTDRGLCLRWLCLLWPKYSLMCAVMAQTKQPPQKQLHWLLGFKEVFIITKIVYGWCVSFFFFHWKDFGSETLLALLVVNAWTDVVVVVFLCQE